jgi:ubiquinone/menaquinone biosynthesis C-methylase UbiE
MRDEEYRAMFELEERLWWYEGMRGITASLLGPALKKGRKQRVLDIGCGTGYSCVWLRQRFGFACAYGIDVSPRAAEFWQARRLDTVALATADKLPFEENEFDLVTCFDVIYQLDDERASQAVAEIHRVLRPGGLLFMREPAYEWLRGSHDIAVSTQHRYTLTELKRLLVGEGLAPIGATYANTLLLGAAVLRRLASRARRSSGSDVRPIPGWLNAILGSVLRLEARLLNRVSFPFGLSAIVVAQKLLD